MATGDDLEGGLPVVAFLGTVAAVLGAGGALTVVRRRDPRHREAESTPRYGLTSAEPAQGRVICGGSAQGQAHVVNSGALDRVAELLDRRIAGLELVRAEQHDVADLRLGQHHGHHTAGCGAHRFGLVVAVVGVERDGEAVATRSPVGALPQHAVGDVAQRAVSTSQTRADPVGQLAAKAPVCVVDADESDECDPTQRLAQRRPLRGSSFTVGAAGRSRARAKLSSWPSGSEMWK